ncbi:MAG: hypothetical protein M0Q42_00990 [Xanthomonadales bacterium]|nr:hypothetical protein [Xanthomonadales bacterium]
MIERFNARISQLLATHRLPSGEDLERAPARYAWLQNSTCHKKRLKRETPVQALKRWQASRSGTLRQEVRNQPGPDTFLFRDECWATLATSLLPGTP